MIASLIAGPWADSLVIKPTSIEQLQVLRTVNQRLTCRRQGLRGIIDWRERVDREYYGQVSNEAHVGQD